MARSTKGLYKRRNVWWMTYRDALGTQRFESCRTRKKGEAEGQLIARRKEALEGLAPAPTIKPVALEDLLSRYLDFVSHQRGVRTKRLHVQHLKRLLGNPPIHTLNVEVLDCYRETRRAEGVGPATVNRDMSTLKHAMSKAVAWKMIRKAVREDLAGVQKYQEPAGRLRYLADQQAADLLLGECRGVLKPIVTTALHTGMRKGEILGLTWGEVNLDQGYIRLSHTKNGEPRSIPLNETTWAVFHSLKGERENGVAKQASLEQAPVFRNLDGQPLRDIRHPFEDATKRAGLVDFHFHDLRHTFASWLVMAGIPLPTVSKLLGHKSMSMTMRYTHLSPQHMTAAVRVLDKERQTSLDNHLTKGGSASPQEVSAVIRAEV